MGAVRVKIEKKFGGVLADAQVANRLSVFGIKMLADGVITDVVLLLVVVKTLRHHSCSKRVRQAAAWCCGRDQARTCAELFLDRFLTLLASLSLERFKSLHDLRMGVGIVSVPPVQKCDGEQEETRHRVVMGANLSRLPSQPRLTSCTTSSAAMFLLVCLQGGQPAATRKCTRCTGYR